MILFIAFFSPFGFLLEVDAEILVSNGTRHNSHGLMLKLI